MLSNSPWSDHQAHNKHDCDQSESTDNAEASATFFLSLSAQCWPRGWPGRCDVYLGEGLHAVLTLFLALPMTTEQWPCFRDRALAETLYYVSAITILVSPPTTLPCSGKLSRWPCLPTPSPLEKESKHRTFSPKSQVEFYWAALEPIFFFWIENKNANVSLLVQKLSVRRGSMV